MDQIKQLFGILSWTQRISLLIAIIAVGGGLTALSHWNRERDFRPLYTNLAAEDAGALVAKLKENGIDYRLGENGSAVLVSSEKVAEARLAMATAGLPKSGRIGFELFDKTAFGASDFTEQVNYHRAIEGELERSVMSITEVEQARVHLTMAKESLYTESRKPAKASVLVKLRVGARLSGHFPGPRNLRSPPLPGAASVIRGHCRLPRAQQWTLRKIPRSRQTRKCSGGSMPQDSRDGRKGNPVERSARPNGWNRCLPA